MAENCHWNPIDPAGSIRCFVEQVIVETIVSMLLWIVEFVLLVYNTIAGLVLGLGGPLGASFEAVESALLVVPETLLNARESAVAAAGPAAPIVDVLLLAVSVAAVLTVATLLVSLLPGTDGVRTVVNRWT